MKKTRICILLFLFGLSSVCFSFPIALNNLQIGIQAGKGNNDKRVKKNSSSPSTIRKTNYDWVTRLFISYSRPLCAELPNLEFGIELGGLISSYVSKYENIEITNKRMFDASFLVKDYLFGKFNVFLKPGYVFLTQTIRNTNSASKKYHSASPKITIGFGYDLTKKAALDISHHYIFTNRKESPLYQNKKWNMRLFMLGLTYKFV